jgi:hypothetical protein
MTTTNEPSTEYSTSSTPSSPSTPSCDPDYFARLKCVGKGIEARAQYNKDNEAALTTARTRYDAARGLYTTARTTAQPVLAQAQKDLDKVFERLDCMLDTDVKQKLEAAADQVGQRLRSKRWGCYLTTDCDFEDDVRNCPPKDVPSRIADIQRRTKEAEDFFAVRIEEPTKVGERVTKLQAEIADLTNKVNSDPAPADLPKLYADALVARLHYDMVWDGFDSVDDYMNCLCTALNCIFGGHTAISRLKQKEAVAMCWAERQAETEQQLQDDPAQAVLDLYAQPSDNGSPGTGGYGAPTGGYGEPPAPRGGYQPPPESDEPKPPQGYQPTPPQGYPPGPSPEYKPEPRRGYQPTPPPAYRPQPPQGYPGPPPEYKPEPPQGYPPTPPPAYRPQPPQGYPPEPPPEYKPEPPQGYPPTPPPEYKPEPPQGYPPEAGYDGEPHDDNGYDVSDDDAGYGEPVGQCGEPQPEPPSYGQPQPGSYGQRPPQAGGYGQRQPDDTPEQPSAPSAQTRTTSRTGRRTADPGQGGADVGTPGEAGARRRGGTSSGRRRTQNPTSDQG